MFFEMSALYLSMLTLAFIVSQTCEQHCNYICTNMLRKQPICHIRGQFVPSNDGGAAGPQWGKWHLGLRPLFSVIRADGLPACWLRKLRREKKILNFNWKNEFLLIQANCNFGGSGASIRHFFRRPRPACLRACHTVGPWPNLSSAEELLGMVIAFSEQEKYLSGCLRMSLGELQFCMLWLF